ncbi:zinc finger MYND domain-containing protein 11-like isoform X2 [Acanthaster planci]|uniref:Zinc finger MYND domain-containing protein 11-like isoform X2 n=1 Tax=Acanthaster planci TaxID=133434 RepID=A0A8B7YE32_ACAPL|nr:zinc finger MYND domain-containing protein 11-like isoform X2 [Acanthaster planci]
MAPILTSRRMSNPHTVQQLWEAVTAIRNQKQVANMERILKFMKREYGVSAKETQQQLAYATKDGLIVKDNSRAKKGVRAGQEQEAYWCTVEQEDESKESHDWYCCKCHGPGEVLCCGSCYRVYHPDCVPEGVDLGNLGSSWTCPVCRQIKSPRQKLTKPVLYKLLNHVLKRMKDKARDLHKKLNMGALPNYYNLVYRHVDLATIMQKVEDKRYRCIEEFQADAEMMVHTAVIYHGQTHERTDLCQFTLNDCNYDLAEIQLCKDCYLMSNSRTDKGWFCKPCDPAHEVVWAQMKGFGYWPAKVLQRVDSNVDVRFFGSRHQRAWIPEEKTRDISVHHSKLSVKATQGWRKALKELHTYLGKNPRSDSEESVDSKPTRKRSREDSSKTEGSGENEDDVVSSTYSDGDQVETKQSRLQDHSVSTSQASPDGVTADENTVKKEHSSSTPPSSPNPAPPEVIAPPPNKKLRRNSTSTVEHQEMPQLPKVPDGESGSGAPLQCKCQEVFDAMLAEKLAQQQKELQKEHQKALEKAVKEALKKAKEEFKAEKEKALAHAKESAKMELEAERKEAAERAQQDKDEELEKLKTKHKEEISFTKKRQWCINCEQEAMYHCCWNTSYCSISCQQSHWHKEHKRLCRRKR